uniref:Uncharacterized protein n=1 Tax=Anguilla anguilla TaxID=7936 RepID=A0A0E9RS26_ANGAN
MVILFALKGHAAFRPYERLRFLLDKLQLITKPDLFKKESTLLFQCSRCH